jgi:ABC-2 type transport system ATP-binding protein
VHTIDGLREAAGATGQVRVTMEVVPEELVGTIEGLDGVTSVSIADSTLTAGCENRAKGEIVHRCYQSGTIENVETSEASLEDLFVSYTGGGA